ncbi:MAG TPA: Rid family detoxifying hydrolase [Synergistales bacterium]|nr:Rid family detoxifying hydrolase [Synergistales bacterium]
MRTINTSNAPEPSGHYSQAVVHEGLVYVSGQLPIDPETGEKQLGTIEEQSARVLANLEAILKASGSGKGKVIKVTVYVSNIVLWDRVNKVYADFFGDHKPARVVVPTRDLHYGFQIEMDAVAAVDVEDSK